MVCRCYDDCQNECWVEDSQQDEEALLPSRARDLRPALEDLRVVDQGASDDQGVAKVQTGHRGELVGVFAALPYRLRVVVSHGVVESVTGGKESWWHAGPKAEDGKGEKVAKRHCASCDCKGGVGWSVKVVPADEEDGTGYMDE